MEEYTGNNFFLPLYTFYNKIKERAERCLRFEEKRNNFYKYLQNCLTKTLQESISEILCTNCDENDVIENERYKKLKGSITKIN